MQLEERRLRLIMDETKENALIVLPTGVLGGAERVMFNLASYLVTKNISVTVYIMSRGEQVGWSDLINDARAKVIFKNYKSEKSSLFFSICSLIGMTNTVSYKYVFTTHTHVNGFLSLLRRFKLVSCEYLISRESTFIFERFYGVKRFVFHMIYRFCYGSQDLLISQTDEMKYSLISNLGFSPVTNFVRIDNPLNLDNINRMLNTSDTPVLAKQPVKIIVACGRLIRLKGFEYLVKSFAIVNKRFAGAVLYILGEGEERANLQALILDLGLTHNVFLIGQVSNPLIWFKVSDVGVISSSKEGFPNTILEMMAAGTKSLISTNCSDGVLELPGVDILDDFSENAMAAALEKNLVSNVDNAKLYFDYVRNNRSVDIYWEKLTKSL